MQIERLRYIRRMSRELAKPIQITTPVHQTSYEMDGRTYDIDVWHRNQYEFPVSKLDDEWLTSRASPEEANELIEGWLQGIVYSLKDYRRSPIAKKYNIVKPLDEPLERLIAYAELMEEYSMVCDGYLEKNIEGGAPDDMDRAEKAQQVQDLIMNKFILEQYQGNDAEDLFTPLRTVTETADNSSVIRACNTLFAAAFTHMEQHNYTDLFGNMQYQEKADI
ncbi:hypothetical protein IPM65_03970 [Candidatus Roizmanbacteria bacterium]|nr:MAG: hypothetical protein IPM65_03970 [Candidatus Roizmanbacteria bacterium]